MRHEQRLDDARNTNKIYEADLTPKLTKWRRKDRWKCDVENDIKKMGTNGSGYGRMKDSNWGGACSSWTAGPQNKKKKKKRYNYRN